MTAFTMLEVLLANVFAPSATPFAEVAVILAESAVLLRGASLLSITATETKPRTASLMYDRSSVSCPPKPESALAPVCLVQNLINAAERSG